MTPVGNVGAADGSFSPPSTANYVHIVTDCEQGKEPHQWGGHVVSGTGQRERVYIRCSLCGRDVLDELSRFTTELAEARRERDEARQICWDAYRAAGGDTDGDATPAAVTHGLREMVVGIVTDLRNEIDEAWNPEVVKLESELARANAVIERVGALHVPIANTGNTPKEHWREVCNHCRKVGSDTLVAYPCPTRTILEGNGA